MDDFWPHDPPHLFDEHADPDFRSAWGFLARRSTRIDVALTRIRLSTLDLRPAELSQLEGLRLLLGEVNSVSLDAEAHALMRQPERGGSLRHLAGLLEDGLIEIRAAPLAGWSPDFTVFRRGGRAAPFAVLLGFHWFQRPFPHRGPALASLHGPDGAATAGRRFHATWARAHDIRPAVRGILDRARGVGDRAGTKSGKAQRRQGVPAGWDGPPGA